MYLDTITLYLLSGYCQLHCKVESYIRLKLKAIVNRESGKKQTRFLKTVTLQTNKDIRRTFLFVDNKSYAIFPSLPFYEMHVFEY